MIGEIFLNVSFTSNYIFFYFISALQQTVKLLRERVREKITNKFSFKSELERREKNCRN